MRPGPCSLYDRVMAGGNGCAVLRQIRLPSGSFYLEDTAGADLGPCPPTSTAGAETPLEFGRDGCYMSRMLWHRCWIVRIIGPVLV
jgi:hypothetical protein